MENKKRETAVKEFENWYKTSSEKESDGKKGRILTILTLTNFFFMFFLFLVYAITGQFGLSGKLGLGLQFYIGSISVYSGLSFLVGTFVFSLKKETDRISV